MCSNRSGCNELRIVCRFAIVQPVEGDSKLQLMDEGMAVLKKIRGPIAPVVVIGPYRSGKSFTLNQLMNVGCDQGFGVGHSRQTQTKGIWVWGEPVVSKTGKGEEVNVVFIDTEGFESTGKADVYDDRIFALSTLMSDVLIYNLPESIRESDLEKLSFAAELGKAFYSANGAPGAIKSIDPASMIWLIQRDFLEGDSLQQTLMKALQPVENPQGDPGLAQLNHIRQGLKAIAKSSTAIGLPQPHLDRTKLCDLDESAFDRKYVQQRDALRRLVFDLVGPKEMGGRVLDGEGLASLIEQTVKALNEREIPTAGSLVQYFNRDLVSRCQKKFVEEISRQRLPVDESELKSIGDAAAKKFTMEFERNRFGADMEDLRSSLEGIFQTELDARYAANELASTKVCEHAELDCEVSLEREASQRLPSLGRFNKKFDTCKKHFENVCIGPGKFHNLERLKHAWEREEARFQRDFNDKLLNGIIVLSIIIIVAFRFIIKWALGETAGWIIFVFLQVYPKLFIGSSSSMYETKGWHTVVSCWEAVINNPIIDLERMGMPLMIFLAFFYVFRRPLLRVCRRMYPRIGRKKTHGSKDLDV